MSMAAKPFPPVTARPVGPDGDLIEERLATLELEDGSAYQGFSFGADKSVSGELVFQTGNSASQCAVWPM
jgi:carbamoyl-phosphate synthase/aspartate carbamoyltransferase